MRSQNNQARIEKDDAFCTIGQAKEARAWRTVDLQLQRHFLQIFATCDIEPPRPH